MDKLQALMDAAEYVAHNHYKMVMYQILETIAAPLESLRSALASGEVVVTTFSVISECPARDFGRCTHSMRLSNDCTRSNCPRLPKVTE